VAEKLSDDYEVGAAADEGVATDPWATDPQFGFAVCRRMWAVVLVVQAGLSAIWRKMPLAPRVVRRPPRLLSSRAGFRVASGQSGRSWSQRCTHCEAVLKFVRILLGALPIVPLIPTVAPAVVQCRATGHWWLLSKRIPVAPLERPTRDRQVPPAAAGNRLCTLVHSRPHTAGTANRRAVECAAVTTAPSTQSMPSITTGDSCGSRTRQQHSPANSPESTTPSRPASRKVRQNQIIRP